MIFHTRSGVLSTRYFEGDDVFEILVGDTIIFSLCFIRNKSSFDNKLVSVDNKDKCGDDEQVNRGNDDDDLEVGWDAWEWNNNSWSLDWEFWLEDV